MKPIDNELAAELGLAPDVIANVQRALASRNGRKGGKSTSPRKLAAIALNAKKGGRPRKEKQ